MVALQHQQLRSQQPLPGLLRYVPRVGEKPHAAIAGGDVAGAALPGIVAGGEQLHLHIRPAEGLVEPCGAQQSIHPRRPVRQLARGAWRADDGGGVFFDIGSQALDVVAVLVGDEHGGQVLRRQGQSAQSLADTAAGDAHIDQHAGLPADGQGGVAGGAAGEGAKGGHGRAASGRGADGELLLRALNGPDTAADAPDLADDVLIPPLNILHIGNLADALGGQSRNQHGRAGPQVAGLQLRPGQALHALDNGQVPVDLDLRAHALELVRIPEAAVPHAVRDDAGALGQAQGRRNLGLHVRGEAGVGHGLDIGAHQGADAADREAVVHFLDLHAHLRQLRADAVHVLGNDVADLDGPAAGRYGGHIRARLDLVRYDGIGAAGEPLHAPDLDDVRAGSHDVRAHGVQKVGHVHDMGLLGGVFNDRQHNVDGSAYGHLVQENVGPLHPAAGGLRHNKAALGVHLHAQGPEALQVLVNGARAAEVTPAGQGYVRRTEAAQ